LAQYGAVGVLAMAALPGLAYTVKQYKRSNEMFIEYLRSESGKTNELVLGIANTLSRMDRHQEDMGKVIAEIDRKMPK
jgi:hypothetical protein